MNTIRPLFIVLFPVIALAFALPISFGAEMPRGIQTLIDKRKEAIRKIDKVFVEELEKVKTAYVKAGDLEKANLAAELIKNTSVTGTDEVFSLDGEWRYRMDGKAVSIVRRFKGNKLIDEGGVERHWEFVNDGITIWWNPRMFEKLVIDPKTPDVIKGANHDGARFTYTRIK